MTVPPTAAAVASPVPVMFATVALELAQLTARPVSGLPAASIGTAVYCTVPPVAMVSNTGVTLTDATGASTVIVAEPLLPPALAVIVAVPKATAVSRPEPETTATLGLSLDQVTCRKNTRFPCPSASAAASWAVVPGNTVTDEGVTVTVPTASCRTALQVPLEPSPHVTAPLRLEAGVPAAWPV